MRAKLAVIGDVHGESAALNRALDELVNRDVTVVMLGDYVNRGPHSKGVLDTLVSLKSDIGDRLVLLRGNHDQALLDYLSTGDLPPFAAHGGLATIRSYAHSATDAFSRFRDRFPREHRELLDASVDYYEGDGVLLSHSGFNPADPMSRKSADMRGLGNAGIFKHKGPWPTGLTVCGHYIQSGGAPYMSERLVCIDTGCGSLPNAPLTVLTLPDMTLETF
jgi:serine/threonine protein phosphatase 1